MPTSQAELEVLITARDEASARLRALGQEVAQLNQRVASVSGGFGGGLIRGITGVADAMRIVQGVAQTAGQAIGAVADQIRQGFQSNVELERATIAFQRYTGSAQEAAQIISVLRREAATSPFNDQEVISAGRALIAYANGSTDALLDLVRTTERLAVLDPFQGIEGGIRAIQEGMGGNFRSFADRFEIPLTMIERWQSEGVPAIEIFKRALDFRGIDTGAIEAYGRSFEGLLSTIQSFGQELRGLVTGGPFRALEQLFAHVVAIINQFGDQLRVVAAAIGEVFARLATEAARTLAPLLGLLDQLLPGFRAFAEAELARPIEEATEATRKATPVVQELARTLTLAEARQGLAAATGNMERLQALAAQTAAPVAAINRELGQVGVQAAELQLGADRIRQGFEAQLRPLERQLELLQNSAEVQRIQQALASNRALSERLQLTREIQALERAAGGAQDPEAAGLTPRQQAIALALQERRLRLEALDVDKQRGPAIQTLQQQIAELRRKEQDALQPSEDLLATYKDRVAQLQIESQRWQNVKGDIDQATASIKAQQDQIAAGPGDAAHQRAIEDAKTKGQQVADAWLKSYRAWLDANGGSLWSALAATFKTWYDGGGKKTLGDDGALIGQALWDGVVAAISAGPSLQDIIKAKISEDLDFTRQVVAESLRRRAEAVAAAATAPGGALGPGAAPALPTVSPAAAAAAGAPPGGGGPTVTVEPGAVQVNGQPDAVRTADLREFLRQALEAYSMGLAASAASTDPGADRNLQGAGRR